MMVYIASYFIPGSDIATICQTDTTLGEQNWFKRRKLCLKKTCITVVFLDKISLIILTSLKNRGLLILVPLQLKILTQILTRKCFEPKKFLTKKIFWPKKIFDPKNFFDFNFFDPKIFWQKIFFYPIFFSNKTILFLTKIFRPHFQLQKRLTTIKWVLTQL